MKKLLKKIEWLFDFYIAPMLYNDRKYHRYIDYMKKKYGNQRYVKVSEDIIAQLTNDMELGKRVREIYWDTKK